MTNLVALNPFKILVVAKVQVVYVGMIKFWQLRKRFKLIFIHDNWHLYYFINYCQASKHDAVNNRLNERQVFFFFFFYFILFYKFVFLLKENAYYSSLFLFLYTSLKVLGFQFFSIGCLLLPRNSIHLFGWISDRGRNFENSLFSQRWVWKATNNNFLLTKLIQQVLYLSYPFR